MSTLPRGNPPPESAFGSNYMAKTDCSGTETEQLWALCGQKHLYVTIDWVTTSIMRAKRGEGFGGERGGGGQAYHTLLICAAIHVSADFRPGITVHVIEPCQVIILLLRPFLLPDVWVHLRAPLKAFQIYAHTIMRYFSRDCASAFAKYSKSS